MIRQLFNLVERKVKVGEPLPLPKRHTVGHSLLLFNRSSCTFDIVTYIFTETRGMNFNTSRRCKFLRAGETLESWLMPSRS